MWDHSKISSGRFVAGVNETKSKIFLLKNIGYFRDICHKLFLNNACFAADVVGFMIHILGLRIFPKSFGFFLVCSQQDLSEIMWEIPPKKGYGNMLQNMFKELFVDISNK